MATGHQHSILLKNGLVFDGSGAPGQLMDVLVRQGRIVAMGPGLSEKSDKVIDCNGRWVIPGMLDVHTHLDLEVELAPELPEVVRHGTTTVVMSNCSLGVAFGNQRKNGADPIVDCFARVENVPKHVLRKVGDVVTWNDSGDYLDHFDDLNLGPNVVAMVPHSMLRIEVMGLQDSLTREPTSAEMQQMEALVEKGMQEGFVGFSTDALPFHFLANKPNTEKQIPTQFAPFWELKRLTNVVRRWGRVWQATPPKDSRIGTFKTFLLTSGRLYGRTLKTTAVAALDLHTNRSIVKMALTLSKLLNGWLLKGHFRLQALAAPFKVWSDGVVTPLAEEVPELRRLNELDLDDRAGRLKILNDPDYVTAFKKMWFRGKSGFSLANLKRRLGIEDNVLNRCLDDMFVADCPLQHWNGKELERPYERLQLWQVLGGQLGAMNEEEAKFFATFPNPVGDDAEFFLHLLRQWDTQFRWHTTTANRDPQMVKDLLFNPLILPGFNDSGAHLTNMAFYDCNLRNLKIAQEDGLDKVALAVHRLTQEPAEFFGLNAGVLKIGAQADVAVIDPQALANWGDPEDTVRYIWRDLYEHHQMVNRPEGIVTQVLIAGHLAWDHGHYTAEYGKIRMGRYLRAKDHPDEQAWVRGEENDKERLAA
jgi:N-acyl-D-aspartate/D-glutamate deacylase